MKLGLGLYRGLLSEDNFKFAKQAGVTHLVVHLVDYFKGKNPELSSGSTDMGWGNARIRTSPGPKRICARSRSRSKANGLVWEAIENFDPSHWHDILLDGPKKQAQMEQLKRTIRTIGRVGIPIMGYNFSLAGVWGWTKGPWGRGGARRVDLRRIEDRPQAPMPNGMVWNMVYDPKAPAGTVRRCRARGAVAALRMVPLADRAGGRGSWGDDGAASGRSTRRHAARHGAAGEPAGQVPARARSGAEQGQRPRVLSRLVAGDARGRRVREHRALRQAGQDRLRPLPQRARQGAATIRRCSSTRATSTCCAPSKRCTTSGTRG